LANVKIIWINFKGLVPTACRSTLTSATWNNFHETHTMHLVGRIQFLTLQQATGYCETFVLYPTIFFFQTPFTADFPNISWVLHRHNFRCWKI